MAKLYFLITKTTQLSGVAKPENDRPKMDYIEAHLKEVMALNFLFSN